jgi:CheY-like chemotaxis protein
LLELAKPILNGMEATRILKSQPIAPVVIMTCSDELPGMQRAGLAAGADAFVSKSELIERLPLLLNGLAKASACESSSLVELA